MKKCFLGIFLLAVMIASICPAKKVLANEPVQFKKWDGSAMVNDSCTSYTVIDSQTAWSSGWYVVNSTVSIDDRIVVTGEVSLILTDGITLTASKGITVASGNSLTIYGQSSETGKLVATADTSGYVYGAGIGGVSGNATCGEVTIHSGIVDTTGSYRGAGIGGGERGHGGTVTICGGSVTATGGTGCHGIGGGAHGGINDSGTLFIAEGIDVINVGNSAPGTAIDRTSLMSDHSYRYVKIARSPYSGPYYVNETNGRDAWDGKGSSPFQTLARAVSAAGSNPTTIILLSDISVSGNFAFGTTNLRNRLEISQVTKTVTIDLNGHTISSDNSTSIFTIWADADVTIDDTSAAKTGKINNTNTGNCRGVENLGKFTLIEGTISCDVSSYGNGWGGGGVCVDPNALFNMEGGCITGCKAGSRAEGAGVYVSADATFNLSGGSISSNTASSNGGGVSNYGTFNMTGGEISNNTAGGSANGGGVYVKGSSATFTMSGGRIVNCSAASTGGGVRLDDGATFNFQDGVISNCTAQWSGGVQIQGSILNMTGGTIEYCAASGHTGGLIISGSTATATITGGSIMNNTGASEKGGVCLEDNSTLILGGNVKITGNVTGGEVSGTYPDFTLSGGEPSNLFIPDGAAIQIGSGAAAPVSGMQVGVSVQHPGNTVFTTASATADSKSYFSCDSSTDYGISFNTSESVLCVVTKCDIMIECGDHGTVTYGGNSGAVPDDLVTLTVTPDTGYSLDTIAGKYNDGSGEHDLPLTKVDDSTYTFVMHANAVIITASFKQNSSPYPGPSPDPSPAPAPEKKTPAGPEKFTVPVTGDDTVQVEADIKDGNASVKDIRNKDIKNLYADSKNGKVGENSTVTIDLSTAKQEVTSVTLTKQSVKSLAKAANDESSPVETVEIKLTNATIVLDSAALSTISREMKGQEIKIVVEEKTAKDLTSVQQEALKDMNVEGTFDAHVESGGVEVHEFNGGNVEVSLDFEPEAGKDPKHYFICYVADDGSTQKFETRYENGRLTFVTTHLSDYVIVYDETKENATKTAEAPVFALKKTVGSGKKIKLRVTNIADDAVISYTSSDESIATVNKKGVIKAVGVGECSVNCVIKQNGASYKFEINVRVLENCKGNRQIKASECLTPNSTTPLLNIYKLVNADKPVKLNVGKLAKNATVTYSVEDETIASVSEGGVITGLADGTTGISVYVTQKGQTYQYRLFVRVSTK